MGLGFGVGVIVESLHLPVWRTWAFSERLCMHRVWILMEMKLSLAVTLRPEPPCPKTSGDKISSKVVRTYGSVIKLLTEAIC